MLFVFVLMEEGGGCVGDGGDAYLPSCRAVAVAFVFEVGDGSHHPVINLGQCQSLVRRALNGFGYQVGVGEIPPGVAARGGFSRGLLGGQAAGGQRARGGRRGVRGERGASALLAGGGERSIRCRAVAALVLCRQARAIAIDGRRGGIILLIVLFFGYDICVMALRFHRVRVWSWQRPGARSGPLLGLEVRVDDYVQVREWVGERSLGHDVLVQAQSRPRCQVKVTRQNM